VGEPMFVILNVLSALHLSSNMKRRGQAALPNKKASTRYAEAVAKRKVDSQPENYSGLTSTDVLVEAM
jgi:hypothetical protein